MSSTESLLQNAFEFSGDDLAANRDGKITDWQRRRLHEKRSAARLGFAAPGVPLLFILTVGRNSGPFILLMVALMVYLAYMAYQRWSKLQLESQMADGLMSVYGWASKHVSRSRNSTTYWLEVNGHRFTLTRDQYDNLTEGIEYHVYSTPYTRTILSLEAEESRANQRGYLAERLGTL